MTNLSDEERIEAFCRELASVLRRLLGIPQSSWPDAQPPRSRQTAQPTHRKNPPDAARKSRAGK